jgi:lipopolysaccharide biosynthesis glycosyltransferase
VLYLDVDTLCLRSLYELFAVDLQDNIAAAARDGWVPNMSEMDGLPGLGQYPEVQPLDPYFDSGVLLVDVRRWLAASIEPKSFAYIQRHAHETRFSDQDALNYALHGKWLIVSNKWNHVVGPLLESPMEGALEEAAIIQQIGPIKPWHANFPSSKQKTLYEYYSLRAEAATEAHVV